MTVIAGGCVLSRPVTTARSWITSGKLVQKLEFLGDDCKCKTTTLRTLGMPKKLDQTTGIVRSLPIFANALLLTTPLEALAEAAACEQPDQSIFNMNMPLLLLVALIGATVGGLVARQRKAELLRLNEQLRQINAALKRQAKIESYAPALSYAPAATRVPDDQVLVDPRKQELRSHLKNGKNFLRNQNPEKAYTEFKIALELAQNLRDPIEEKKAARGLGASLQRQGKHKEAIKYHSMVLSISEREGEDSGNTEAFGAIADCYTEIGDLEKAATFYDQYIARLQAD
ncbi:putative tetratricopeptide-like helical domain superfamily, protein FLUORESCENT IN BLUE LIGHT [Helianthus debilis subsp. tardiflorus]